MRDARPAEAASVVCALALPISSEASSTYALSVRPARYGLDASKAVSVSDLQTGAKLGKYAAGTEVTFASELPALSVLLLKLQQE